jgi:hypothetical protein
VQLRRLGTALPVPVFRCSTWAGVAFAYPEIGCDLCELVEGRLQVLDNFGCKNSGVRCSKAIQAATAREGVDSTCIPGNASKAEMA